MKRHNIINSISIGAISILVTAFGLSTANCQETTKSPLMIGLSYTTLNNNIPYVVVTAKSKIDGRFKQIKGAEIKIYLDKDSAGKPLALISKVVTNAKGEAGAILSPELLNQWKTSTNHTFIATYDKTAQFDETSADISISKSRLIIDTADDKNITATFNEFKDGNWIPVKGVELKLAVKRLGGDLQIGEEQSFTTDSLGRVKGELKKLGLPGDEKGNIIIVAKIEDNDKYGNLRVEKSIPWGKVFIPDHTFFQQSALWASRFHSPIWLVILAYSIIIGVWGTLIYLIMLLLKIKKLGKEAK